MAWTTKRVLFLLINEPQKKADLGPRDPADEQTVVVHWQHHADVAAAADLQVVELGDGLLGVGRLHVRAERVAAVQAWRERMKIRRTLAKWKKKE